MLFWSKNKGVIIFLILLIGIPFLITKVSKTFFPQEASSISSGTSPCLKTNPPTVWIEKDIQSRKGYAPSGVKNTEIMNINFINCGEVNLRGLSFLIESSHIEDIVTSGGFRLHFLDTDFLGVIKQLDEEKALISFSFDIPINIVYTGSIYKIKLVGVLPNDYSGKTTFSINSVDLVEGGNSNVEINRVKSTLVFVKKQ